MAPESMDISIVLCGPAGQGVQTAEQLMVAIFREAGLNVFATKEYMSRVRGGSNSTTIRISPERVRALVDRMDIFVPLDSDAYQHCSTRISQDTIILGEEETFPPREDDSPGRFENVPLSSLAKEAGKAIYKNVVMVGVIAALCEVDESVVRSCVQDAFRKRDQKIIDENLSAIALGYEAGAQLQHKLPFTAGGADASNTTEDVILNGGEAVALGAIAGGCRFISSYPMTPSTSVLTFLAQHGADFDIVAEQAEDEIAAINMALGAWYAGARSMVSTSGGGFALMVEGLSLAAMTETPIVIHLAQRPGPATGLPTRTEQGELLFALHAGHGEFPRAIFAPGTLDDAFHLTQKAFNLADRYQVPVFVLTDQYFIDSYYNLPPFDFSGFEQSDALIRTAADYERYAFTEDGVTPRGIPGHGDGLVVVDSDEHDEKGHITEDHDIRTRMVQKRLKKLDALTREALPPEWIGPQNAETLVVCWGSTVHLVTEAIDKTKGGKHAVLYFKQVYPLHPGAADLLRKAKRLCIVENNATAQFAQIIQSRLQVDIPVKILKYNGLAFTVEELVHRLDEAAG
ncbi:MAG: 2-oxoacid:acceptor oxidoreductase subunit alpha [Thermoleophilia bacterium]|nr:2-oxoacid:acceptor oxidoreductase subunit alpha [Thermoleophilia bacterium]